MDDQLPSQDQSGPPQKHPRRHQHLHEAKRAKIGGDDGTASNTSSPSTVDTLLNRLLFHGDPLPSPAPRLPDSCTDRHDRLAQYFQAAGMRTSLVSSPQAAVSVYVDEDRQAQSPEYEGVWAMLGLHPMQMELERRFVSGSFRDRVQVLAFTKRMLHGLPTSLLEVVRNHLQELQDDALSDRLQGKKAAAHVASSIATICTASSSCPGAHQRPEALEREAQRLRWRHSSLASTLLQAFIDSTGLTLGEVVYRPSPTPRMTRVTLMPWTETVGGKHPGPFIFMPALATVLKHGPEALVESMVSSFWSHIWRCGYHPGEGATFKLPVSEQLSQFFRSGIVRNGRTQLRAGFEPQYFLSFYLHGLAGAGKSSFVSKLVPALGATLEEFVDPELDVRFVKQNLNKTYGELNQELTLRPNNNDLSVMSIIQGRRMMLSSSKPGLVVVGLEEVPPAEGGEAEGGGGEVKQDCEDDDEGCHGQPDPDVIEQVASLRLLANRFSGMTGETLSAAQRARLLQQNRGGISDHTTLITVFTSNYVLHGRSRALLSALPMFSNILELHVTAIERDDRRAFSLGFLRYLIGERALTPPPHHQCSLSLGEVVLDVNLEHGDIRDLVRRLHVIAFFASQAAKTVTRVDGVLDVVVTHCSTSEVGQNGNDDHKKEDDCVELHLSLAGTEQQPSVLRLTGLKDNSLLLPMHRPLIDERSRKVVEGLAHDHHDFHHHHVEALGHILDYYFHGVLTPAVVVASSRTLLSTLVDRLAAIDGMHCLREVDALNDRIVKSLYEGSEVRCLRDDIKAFRRADPDAMVVIEVDATSREGQLRIREMLEDTPSMIAFSTARSALQKRGLFFTVLVDDDGGVTPELKSRASIVIT